MKIPIYIFGILVTIVNVECYSTRDAVNLCYQQIKVEDGSDVCYAQKTKCTLNDLGEWVFLYNDTRELELSWENRRFTCFHACTMAQRGEVIDRTNGLEDECSVAAVMGECVTEKWEFIEKGLHSK